MLKILYQWFRNSFSSGESEIEATENLDLINKNNNTNFIITYSYGRALQQCFKVWSKDIQNVEAIQNTFNHRAKMCTLAAQGKWSEILKIDKKIYLSYSNKIPNTFYKNLKLVLKTEKWVFSNLDLKIIPRKKIIIGKKIKKICKKNKVKFIINDDPCLLQN